MTTGTDEPAFSEHNEIDSGLRPWKQSAEERRDFGARMAARGVTEDRLENAGVTFDQAKEALRLAIEEDLGAPLEESAL